MNTDPIIEDFYREGGSSETPAKVQLSTVAVAELCEWYLLLLKARPK